MGELVEVLVDVVERPRFEDALEVERLVRDEVAKRHADARKRCFVKRDQPVPERHHEQRLREVEHLVVERVAGEHQADPLPGKHYRRERHEEPGAKRQELGLVRRQQVTDRLLDRWYQIESGLRFHSRSPVFQGCRQVRSASPTPAPNAVFAGPAMRQVVSCMFISDASVSRERLLSTKSCSTMPTSSSARACRWRAAMRAEPLSFSATAVALCSSEGSSTSRSSWSIAACSLRPL